MNNEPVAWLINGRLFEEYFRTSELDKIIPLYTHPAKHLSLQKVDGELVAVTYTDDEHRIIEVLWERPPAKTLTDEKIEYLLRESIWALGLNSDCLEQENWDDAITVFRAILRKAQEK